MVKEVKRGRLSRTDDGKLVAGSTWCRIAKGRLMWKSLQVTYVARQSVSKKLNPVTGCNY